MKQISQLEIDYMEPKGNKLVPHYIWRTYFDFTAHDLLVLATEDYDQMKGGHNK